MADLILHQFDDRFIRTGDVDGNPVFCLGDLLKALGSKTNTLEAKNSITDVFGEGQVINLPLQASGGVQDVLFVFETGATFLISRSRTEAGKRMNRWLHSEVIPSIRKTGSYSIEPVNPVEPSTPQRQLAPQRDLIDYIEAAKSIGIDRDPILQSLFSQRMAEQLGGKVLSPTQHAIVTVRAHELGYSAKEIGNGAGLGAFVKKQGCKPIGQTKHGKYDVNVYEMTEDLDRAIHAYFS